MSSRFFRLARSLAAAMTVVAIAGVAEAQTRERAGLIGGISLGGGTVGFGGSTGDPAVAMQMIWAPIWR